MEEVGDNMKNLLNTRHVIFIIFMLFISCVTNYDWIPVSSAKYKINERSIIFENNNLTIQVYGIYRSPSFDVITTEFRLSILNKLEVIKIDVGSSKLKILELNENLVYNGYETTAKTTDNNTIVISPDEKKKITLYYYSHNDSLLKSFPYDGPIKVALGINIISDDNIKIEIPEFVFRTLANEEEL